MQETLDSELEWIYLSEVSRQCGFAIDAYEAVRQHFQSEPDDWQTDFVFRSIHSFLTHAAQVSRLCWSTAKKKFPNETPQQFSQRKRVSEVRARRLRQVLGLPETGHILEDRTIRDHLEHYDERLDYWAITSRRRNIVMDGIGPRDSYQGIDASDFMRNFDPNKMEFFFRTEEYSLYPIAVALAVLRQRAKAANFPFAL